MSAVRILEKLQRSFPKIVKVDQATMQGYFWDSLYTCIIVRWSIGYLKDEELVTFLKQAKAHLCDSEDMMVRNYEPGAFIIILDNVAPPCLTIDDGKG